MPPRAAQSPRRPSTSATATTEDAPVSLYHDSPYSISKLIGELYGNYYFQRHQLPFVKARFQNVYGPREILGAGRWRGTVHTVWRNVTPDFHLALAQRRGVAAGQRRQRQPGLHLCRGHGARPDGLRTAWRAGRGLQSGLRCRDDRSSSWRRSSTSSPAIARRWTCDRPVTWDRSGKRFGIHREVAHGTRLRGEGDVARRPDEDDRLDPGSPGHDPTLHRAA